MPEKTLIIDDIPKGQPRARVTRWVTYDPAKESKTFIRWMIKEQWQDLPLLTCPVEVNFKFYMPIPKSTSKRKRELMLLGTIKHDKKPDRDNIEKKISDCMTGIVFRADSQSWKGCSVKLYSEDPHIEIFIRWGDG